ncbi:sarcosine oxidase subunit gamma [Rhodococcus koreensis]|uniref:Sarcosine oxidase subunit gamma n=1 Tax=Rhodococcus koreensis TaxID=99653 RepID=A0A1H4ZGP2_9NOCA|nr:sarcosine oxidase subunit gamma family protein [Rhodococcus koreensis]SED28601.1 sarcosine oxidase subunit gamma [Rhodococcus koreensis]
MADTLTPLSPLHSWNHTFAHLPDTVRITEEPFVTMIDLWVDPTGPGAAAAAAVLGVDLPTNPSTRIEGDAATAIWLGPDEFLITTHTQSPEDLETQLRTAVTPHGGAAIDVSAQRTTLRLTGAHARDILATGCSIDLHPTVFRPGTAVQTMLGLAGVVLTALDDTGTDYRILVRASFARYLAAWLIDAAEEYGTRPE